MFTVYPLLISKSVRQNKKVSHIYVNQLFNVDPTMCRKSNFELVWFFLTNNGPKDGEHTNFLATK